MKNTLAIASILLSLPSARADDSTTTHGDFIAKLSAQVLTAELKTEFKDQTWKVLRKRGDAVNKKDVADWRSIRTKQDWEQLRNQRLKRLRKALGGFPPAPGTLKVEITKTISGDGFAVENLVYRTRPGFWVTANLYRPQGKVTKSPGILIAHSHHRPKTQGELQDMGMTWARQGCHVLVIDQVGHGERADHPFRSAADYKIKDSAYRWWRQDYFFRYDTGVQLHLVGESLMGWMVWDLMRGVDLLIARPQVDRSKIILLGAVAGGGDPAGVTAALDPRIAAAVPFNFGGPQPETRFPLPDDPELKFNYLGGAYWEGTRNLRRTAVDGFLHWIIVGGIAPRHLIYAHEFAWDKPRDPVWKRLNRIYAFYQASDNIDYTLGRGSVKGRPPEATHCTNIGKHHRRRIHQAFRRWFDIRVSPEDEFQGRLDASRLQSMTAAAAARLKPRKLHAVLHDTTNSAIEKARASGPRKPLERRKQMQQTWRRLLGRIEPRSAPRVRSRKTETSPDDSIVVERIALETEPGIVAPLLLLLPKRDVSAIRRLVFAVAQSGKQAFLKRRSEQIAALLGKGIAVCLPDVRGAGKGRGSRGGGGSTSVYALLMETPMLGYRLRDLRAVMKYARTRTDLKGAQFAVWGDSFAEANAPDRDFQVPRRVNRRPRFSEPLGGMLAMLAALYDDDVESIYVRGGLRAFQDVLSSPYVLIPHDVVVPGALVRGDLTDLAAALAPCRVQFDSMRDGLNRTLSATEVRKSYRPAIIAYRSIEDSLRFNDGKSAVSWLSTGL